MTWKDLEVWQRAHALVITIYKLVTTFPPEERFRLTDQFCRSAISVPANIVEGQSRQTTKEYLQFLYHARGSLEETRYHPLLAKEHGCLSPGDYAELEPEYEQVSRMLNALIQSLKVKTTHPRPR